MTEVEELKTELAAACSLLELARKQRNDSREQCAGLQREVAHLRCSLKIAAGEYIIAAGLPVGTTRHEVSDQWRVKAANYYPGLSGREGEV